MYVEKNCCIKHEGRKFCSGGAVVTPEYIIAYPGPDHILNDWHGNAIGRWEITSSWRVNSYIGTHMHQIRAVVDGVEYTGRGFGKGMIYKGKRKANQ